MIFPIASFILATRFPDTAGRVVLAAVVGDQIIGRATFSIQKAPSGLTTEVSQIDLWPEGHRVQILATSIMKLDGYQVQDGQTQSEDGVDSESVLAVYSKAGADLSDRVAKTKKLYALPKGWTLDDPSEAWFISSKPKLGASSTYCAFSTEKRKWIKRTRTYPRDVSVTVGTKKINGHEIVVRDNDEAGSDFSMIVDDQGMPLKFEADGVQYVRTEDDPEPPGIS